MSLERCSSNLSDETVPDCAADDTTTTASSTSSWLSLSSSSVLPSHQVSSSSASSLSQLEEESQPETLETSSYSDVEDCRGASYYYSNDDNHNNNNSSYYRLLRHRGRTRSSSSITEQNLHHHHNHKSSSDEHYLRPDDRHDEPPKEVVHDNDQWNNIQTDVDVETYMAKRSMTANQERWNALTILPNPIFCFYYLWSAAWLVVVQQQQQPNENSFDAPSDWSVAPRNLSLWNRLFSTDEYGCLPGYPDYHSMPALPPLPVVAVFMGIALHAPFSFLYHWQYAFQHGAKHWSRRMDQAMIHVCSACLSFGATGHVPFFAANVVYNLDCGYRLFSPHERPLRNQVRIIVSVLLYTLPILWRGDVTLFVQLWMVFLVSGWCFATYPIGGWSHTVFHLVIALAPRLMLRAAATLPASAAQLELAAQCVVRSSTMAS